MNKKTLIIVGLLLFVSLSFADPTETVEPTPDDGGDSTTDKVLNFIKKYAMIFYVVGALLGLFELLLGLKTLKMTLGLIGFLGSGLPSYILLNEVLDGVISDKYLTIASIGIAVGIGIIVGIFFICLHMLGCFFICGMTGVIVLGYLYPITIGQFVHAKNGYIYYIISLSIILIIGGVPGLYWDEMTTIVGTSMIGSLAICLCVGMLIDKNSVPLPFFYNEFIEKLKDEIPIWWWIYLSVFVVLTILGVIVQYCTTIAKKKEKKDEKLPITAPLLKNDNEIVLSESDKKMIEQARKERIEEQRKNPTFRRKNYLS